MACLFDPNFKRISKNDRLQQVEQQLRSIQQAHEPDAKPTSEIHVLNSNFENEDEKVFQPCISSKQIANINLTADQVTDIFQLYFEKLHIYLPFRMSRSIETIYEVCPLLFWVIVAVASRDQVMVKNLIPHVKQMVSEITLKPARNVEIVQALLILCMWPFPYHSQLEDPSFIYSGMAMHIGLQIGLHRPEFTFEFSSKEDVLRSSAHIRRTTWIACFVVNQMQATGHGVPATLPQDYNLLSSLDHDLTPVYLAQLGHITRLTVTFTAAIGFICRKSARDMPQNIEVIFLAAQLQLFSFALHDDISDSLDLVATVQKAETTACKLIQLVPQSELEFVPGYWSRYVILAAVMLLKILKSPNAGNSYLINNQITLAHQILNSISKVDDDGNQRSDRLLLLFSVLEDKKKWPAIQCRLAASLVYDAIRVSKEYYDEILDIIMNPSDRQNTLLETHSIDTLLQQHIGHQQG
ncbi:Regulatory protein leu3 [Umbelopsis nana]